MTASAAAAAAAAVVTAVIYAGPCIGRKGDGANLVEG